MGGSRGALGVLVIPALVAGISLRAAPVSMCLCERVGLALRIEIPAAVRGYDGGVSRLRAERVPDQVGDGEWGEFPVARRSQLIGSTARSKAETWCPASTRAAVGAATLCGGGYELFVIPAIAAGISLRAAPGSMCLCERVGLARRIEIPAAVRGYDGVVAELENDGGVARHRAERVPDQVGDGEWGEFPVARRSQLIGSTARSKAETWCPASTRAAVGAATLCGGGYELFVIPAIAAGISLRAAPGSMCLCERVGLARRIEIPAAVRGYDGVVAELENDGGVARHRDERVPDQVGDGEWGEFPVARRSQLIGSSARSKAEMRWSASIRAAVGAAMASGGGSELFAIPAIAAGISLRTALVSTRRCDHVGLAQRIEIPAAVRGYDGGVSRLRAERVPDQVGDGEWGEFPMARRSELTDWTARSKAETWWPASIRAAVGAAMASGGGSELFAIPALVAGISLRPALVSTRRCDHVGLAHRVGISAAVRGYDGVVAELENDGGVARYGDERVPDQVGDGASFPRRGGLT